MSITLRPVINGDQEFLFEVYACTRRDEVSAWGWDPAQQDAFLRMQFTAQSRSLEMSHENVSHDIILDEGEPIGRLLVTRKSEEIRLIDIALLPAARGRGIGATLIRNLLDEGDSRDLPVRLEVVKGNPATLLYERLGFVKTGENDFRIQMERRPFGVR